MRKFLTVAASAAALALAAGAAQAATFVGDYSATVNGGTGLIIHTTDLPGAININLTNPGDTASVSLFNIWTPETDVALFEDTDHKPISVLFNFTAPDVFGGAVTGDTFGVWGFVEKGHVTWNSPVILSFGNGGKLKVSLNDADFNKGSWFSLQEGEKYGATIKGKFTLIAASAPEPATWAMMITGFGLVGATIRRRRSVAAAA
jgi:hypothetical protein